MEKPTSEKSWLDTVTERLDEIYETDYKEYIGVHWYLLDDLDFGTLVAFTWNPNPAMYPSSDPNEQYQYCLQNVLYNAEKCLRNYMFVPELTKEGNIHIHGYYNIKDRIRYYKYWLPNMKRLGFVKLKTTVDCGWLKYLLKDVDVTAHVIEDTKPFPFCNENFEHYVERKVKVKYIPRKVCTVKRYTKKYWYEINKNNK